LTKRHYQLFALFLLIGAPLLVSLLTSSLLPGLQQIAPAQIKPQAPEYMQPAPDPAAGLPPAQPEPAPSQPDQSGPQAGGNYMPVATLDPTGTTLTGVDPTPVSVAASDVPPAGQGGQGPGIPSAEDQRATSDVQHY